MRWNLRLAAASRGVWKANDLRRLLAAHGLVISAGKMSGWWSTQPVSIKFADLDMICAALGCDIGELLIPDHETAGSGHHLRTAEPRAAAVDGAPAQVTRLPVDRHQARRHR